MSAFFSRQRLGMLPLHDHVMHLAKQGNVTPVELAGRAGCTRKAAESKLYQMMQAGILKRVARGTYALNKDADAAAE